MKTAFLDHTANRKARIDILGRGYIRLANRHPRVNQGLV